jgi:hypothetical protein
MRIDVFPQNSVRILGLGLFLDRLWSSTFPIYNNLDYTDHSSRLSSSQQTEQCS